ncbi:uncharacterized protein LOC129969230 [Argiope bruennichi]|uniref:Uncharacterized protein n=1 Tax=Argiope bruennichi TaxID=94029 RepID=A0A8T0DZJ5_ARGBR|nr:uncharacterized protein LOC129969230 [Argiope bruennichi]XP_055939677.1 uncharacterized protein LOC129969230 [Argiope bruennichi]KAF8763379.1 hypothetical protein HNY73_021567 [Argiope bruennichi]
MRLQKCYFTSVAALILFLIVPSHGKKAHYNRGSKHSHLERIIEKEDILHPDQNKEIHNHLAKHDDQDECHKAALHKCGQTFLRAHKLLSYLDDDLVAFRTRCGVRTAFFECLKTTREKICSRQYRHLFKVDGEFRKKLTDALWSTRVCVLGLKSVKK